MLKSELTGDLCTEAQYIAEKMLMRKAAKQKRKLPPKFWSDPEWKLEYKSQIAAAHQFLKIYSFNAILDGLKTKEGSWQYSLRTKGLDDIFQKAENNLKIKQERVEVVIAETTYSNKPTISKGIRGKLD